MVDVEERTLVFDDGRKKERERCKRRFVAFISPVNQRVTNNVIRAQR